MQHPHPTRLRYLAGLFLLLAVALAGCGNEQDSRLSNADIAFLKTQRLQQLYGNGSSTVTVTNTTSTTVTITNSHVCDPNTASLVSCIQGKQPLWDTGSCSWTCR